ncbi:MAG: response regulator transcription factor [Verrucomicrobia bacterium]|nr:response regulator transcription factor [Verrucomicrobiota bacterium]
MARKKPNVLIADDHEIVRAGVRNLLESGGYAVCGEASNGREAVKMAEELQPDAVILDVTMPELNGIEAAKQVLKLCPDTKVLVFTVHDAEQVVVEIFRTGAHGYILKSDAGRQLLDAVKCVLEGKHYFSSQVSEVIFDSMRGNNLPHVSAGDDDKPTTREREIIQLLAEGSSNKEVADKLGISVKTVETHRSAVMRKLGLHSIGELVRYAIRNKIIEA